MAVTHNGITDRVADVHAHIYPGKIAEKATASVGRFYDIEMDEVGLPHILHEEGTEAGIERFLVCSVATKVEQVESINAFIAEKCKKYPAFWGLGAWHQDITDVTAELDKIEALGLRGIKLHPDFQKFNIDDENMLEVYAECTRRGLVVLFHTGDDRYEYSAPERLINLIRKVPDLVAIAAHFGGWQAWDRSRKHIMPENVFYDTSSSLMFLGKERALDYLEWMGAERFLFGTDFPMWTPTSEIERFMALGLDETTRDRILYKNFETLFLK